MNGKSLGGRRIAGRVCWGQSSVFPPKLLVCLGNYQSPGHQELDGVDLLPRHVHFFASIESNILLALCYTRISCQILKYKFLLLEGVHATLYQRGE